MGINHEVKKPFLNKPVIAIPDVWEDPIIGFCEDYEDGYPVIRNYLTNEVEVVEYKTFHFNEQRFQLVLRFDAFEIASFVYPEDCGEEVFTKPKTVYRKKPDEVVAILRTNGFWERLKAYLTVRNSQQ